MRHDSLEKYLRIRWEAEPFRPAKITFLASRPEPLRWVENNPHEVVQRIGKGILLLIQSAEVIFECGFAKRVECGTTEDGRKIDSF